MRPWAIARPMAGSACVCIGNRSSHLARRVRDRHSGFSLSDRHLTAARAKNRPHDSTARAGRSRRTGFGSDALHRILEASSRSHSHLARRGARFFSRHGRASSFRRARGQKPTMLGPRRARSAQFRCQQINHKSNTELYHDLQYDSRAGEHRGAPIQLSFSPPAEFKYVLLKPGFQERDLVSGSFLPDTSPAAPSMIGFLARRRLNSARRALSNEKKGSSCRTPQHRVDQEDFGWPLLCRAISCILKGRHSHLDPTRSALRKASWSAGLR